MHFRRDSAIITSYLALFMYMFSISEQSRLNRLDFPEGFIFGAASSAYQYEGATREGRRGPSVWDIFTRNKSNIVDGSNGEVSNDEYHRYVEDIDLMFNMGMDSYRFSISWSRIFPDGKGTVNRIGVNYYNNLIDGLLEKGIRPFVTLFHFDLPQALQDAYGGWLSSEIINDFALFADTCFREFGDRVRHWITFNEPSAFILLGYNNGTFPPKRCSYSVGQCAYGDSAKEPYVAAHNVLLSHAAAVDIYRKQYQAKQNGSVGIALSTAWFVPLRSSINDEEAVERALKFIVGWFLDPVISGDYPAIMRTLVGKRLPSFTEAERRKLSSSIDFIGVNYYSTYYVADSATTNKSRKNFYSDMGCYLTGVRHHTLIGPMAASSWLYIDPSGIYNIVHYIKATYFGLPIYITENGVDEANNVSLSLTQALDDQRRVQYHKDHLLYLNNAIRDGADVRGYFVWSLLDNFEWLSGYSVRFGLYYVDFTTLERYPKSSVHWFNKFLQVNKT